MNDEMINENEDEKTFGNENDNYNENENSFRVGTAVRTKFIRRQKACD